MTLNPVDAEVAYSHELDHAATPALIRSVPRATLRETVDSHTLLRGGRELVILHGEHEYRLRLTQNDKLILTK